ncbi:MAG: MerR family transcriptional regulator [Flavobacteriaceae bacterium]
MKEADLPPLPSDWISDDGQDREIGIAEMAERFGVSLRTLRFYEEKGLLTPRRSGRHRYYGAESRRLMTVIHVCRSVGMPVDQIGELLSALLASGSESRSSAILAQALQTRLTEISELTEALESQRQEADRLLRSLG